ncbi:MAG: hypothetical protein Q3966_00860 [Neisseria sp.]|nr:hypothetical protein [Neisseria sp.]
MVQLEQSNGSLRHMRDYLRHLKQDLNIRQADAYEILTDIRNETKSDDFEDFVLEVMDLVSGWCPEHFKVW